MTDTPPAPPAPPAPTPPTPVAFTPEQQAALDQIVQGRVAQASRSAAQQREQEIQQYLADQQAAADLANADETTRLKAERDKAIADRDAAAAASVLATVQANARLALAAAGMPVATISDGLALLGVDPADDEAAITAKVEALKARLTPLFTSTATGGPTPPPTPGVTPPARPAHQGSGQTAEERAKARFKPVFAKSA